MKKDYTRLKHTRQCYSGSDIDHRSCMCWENVADYCSLGFKESKGIPQEPCPKPLTTKAYLECVGFYKHGNINYLK
jgi:hypothetical protein